MSQEVAILLGTAGAIGFVHTLLGPDHYVPFIVMSKARNWSLRRTLTITALCGLGHVAGSVVLGVVGIAAGITLRSLEFFESARGEIAAWLLIAFGLIYGTWGLTRALRNRPHNHRHAHLDGTEHEHTHNHNNQHVHAHEQGKRSLTPWVLFTVFVLGPCEPLIPLLMFPAAVESTGAVVLVASVFGAVTIATMTAIVLVSSLGFRLVPVRAFGRFGHAVAGFAVFLCGVAIQLGL